MKKLLRICTIFLMTGIISVIAPQLTSQAATDGITYADDTKTIVTKISDSVHVEIPDGVIYITVEAFKDCKNIEELSLPASFEGLVYYDASTKRCDEVDINKWNGILVQCKNFKAYMVAADNGLYRTYKGALYSPKSILYSVPVGYAGEVVMADDAERIYSGALANCNQVTSILLSKNFVSVTTDWDDVPVNAELSKCPNLQAIKVDAKNTMYKSVNGMLYSKAGDILYSVPSGKKGKLNLAEGVIEIADKAFYGCSKLTSVEIPYGVVQIGEDAFSGCAILTTIKLPGSIVKCGKMSVASKLQTVYVPKGCKTKFKKIVPTIWKQYLKDGNYKAEKSVKKLASMKASYTYQPSYEDMYLIQWNRVLYAKQYRIQRKVGNKWKTIKTIQDPSKDEWKLNPKKFKLSNAKKEYFRVVADGNAGVKTISKSFSIVRVAKAGLKSVIRKSGSLVVCWKGNTKADGYRIVLRGNNNTTDKVFYVRKGATKKTLKGIDKNVKYDVIISAYKKVGKTKKVYSIEQRKNNR